MINPMNGLIIREPSAEELKTVVDITNEAFNAPMKADGFRATYNEPYEKFMSQMAEGSVRALVALIDEKIIGVVRYQFLAEDDSEAFLDQIAEGKARILIGLDGKTPDAVWLFKLSVLPLYREKGVAPALMQRVEEIAKNHGCHRIMLDAMVEKGLPPYYEKFGYKTFSVKENNGHHDAVMIKNL